MLNLQINQYAIDPELLVNITAPVLIVSGDKDNVKLAHTVAIYEAIPNAQLSVTPGTTHQLPKEVTMQFNNMLLRFYTKSNPKPGTSKTNPEGDN
ncbi:MAG: alpha/beta hydrolase [Bacteroidetes bacterium]|nr:alpha/beta hydrolase [Bacteroidota bacterium]